MPELSLGAGDETAKITKKSEEDVEAPQHAEDQTPPQLGNSGRRDKCRATCPRAQGNA